MDTFPMQINAMQSLQKTFDIFNFTSTYAILMKLTTDRVYEGINKKTLKMSPKTILQPNLDNLLILKKL